jgi:hypothetical protein
MSREKPVKLPGDFEATLSALLQTPPPPKPARRQPKRKTVTLEQAQGEARRVLNDVKRANKPKVRARPLRKAR